jgi:hypothetical protein
LDNCILKKALQRGIVISILIMVLGTATETTPQASAAAPTFLIPTAGYVGFIYTNRHNGIDIWTSYPDSAPCGNPVRAAYPGKIYKVKKTTAFTAAPTKGDPEASIVVLEHTGVSGLPDTFYTWYLHMAKDDGTGTCISDAVWDNMVSGQEVPAGFNLGRQGNMRLAGDLITHLHFMVSSGGNDDDVTYDPAPFLGLPNLQRGNALLYSDQTINLTLNTAKEQDSVYFYANQGEVATISMDKLNSTLNSYLILYAADGSRALPMAAMGLAA